MLNIGRATDVGNVREINEDTILAEALLSSAEFADPEELTAVLLVADGMGGHQAGEVASRMAGEMTRQTFLVPQAPDRVPAGGGGAVTLQTSGLAERAIDLARRINQAVFAYGGQGIAHPGTTLTLCLCHARTYTIAHVGDSRAYLLTGSGICQLTDDDSWVGEAVRRGTMTPGEARESPHRNQLTRCVGIAEDVQPSLYQGTWQPGNVLLLCSDGLSEYVLPEEIRDAVLAASSLQAACEKLVRLARDRGGHDNISLVSACEGRPQAGSRKPPTWKGDVLLAHTLSGGAKARRLSDPNFALRSLLLTFVGMAFLVIGLAVGRRQQAATPLTHTVVPTVTIKTHPKDKINPVVVPSVKPDEENKPRPLRSEAPARKKKRVVAEDQPLPLTPQKNEAVKENAADGHSGKE